jgi:hypothetical protein
MHKDSNDSDGISRRLFLSYLVNRTKDLAKTPSFLTFGSLASLVLGMPSLTNSSISQPNPLNKSLEDLLFDTPLTLKPPKGEYNRRQINKWKNRYIGADKNYIFNDLSYRFENNLTLNSIDNLLFKGWTERLNDGSLKLIYHKCKLHNMPSELIFLMLAESHGQKYAQSRFAKGYWQFTKATGKAYGLRIDGRIDDRINIQKSTDAALKLLKDNYNMTFAWDNKLSFAQKKKITPDDRRLWAMWSYNMSPSKVRRYFLRLGGDPTNYAYTLRNINPESSNYVNKIFGVYYALKHLRYNPPTTDVSSIIVSLKKGKLLLKFKPQILLIVYMPHIKKRKKN